MAKDNNGNKHGTVTVAGKTIVVENQVVDGKIAPDMVSPDTNVQNKK